MSIVTVRGHVGADPNHGVSERGVAWARFRVAETERIHQQDGSWKDGPTTWFSVSCFNETARNVIASVKCGDPVLVQGKLSIDEWTRSEDGSTSLTPVVRADLVGHDLRYGMSQFSRKQRAETGAAAASPAAAPVGFPPPPDKPANVDDKGVIHGDFDASDGEPADFSADGSESDDEASESSVSFTTSSPDYSTVGS